MEHHLKIREPIHNLIEENPKLQGLDSLGETQEIALNESLPTVNCSWKEKAKIQRNSLKMLKEEKRFTVNCSQTEGTPLMI